MTLEEAAAFVAPRDEDVETLQQFLESHGVPREEHELTMGKGFLKVSMTVASVESMFAVKMQRFRHAETGVTTIKTLDAYTLPEEVARTVDFVGGLIRFPSTSA